MIGLTGLVWYVVIFLLSATGYIRYFPILFNKGLPLYYLIGPSFYLYIRGSIYNQYASFSKIDLLHLLIIIPAVCSIMPYCLLNHDEQQQVVNKVAANSTYLFSGAKYIVGVWHWALWPITALIYTILQFRLIKNASRTSYILDKDAKWMFGMTLICLITFSLLFITNSGMIFRSFTGEHKLISSSMVIILCGCFLTLGLAFFANPSFIYGNFGSVVEKIVLLEVPSTTAKKKQTQKNDNSDGIAPLDIERASSLEAFLAESKIYLETGLTLGKLSVAANIPSHTLSELLNSHYNKNFNAYINSWRIKDVLHRLNNGDHKTLTLEALASEAGFTSRSSFFSAFKKEMNISPSVYIAGLSELSHS